MKINKKIACFILSTALIFTPFLVNIHSYAETTSIDNEEDKREQEERERQEEQRRQKERDYYVAVEMYSDFPKLKNDTQNTLTLQIKNTGGSHLEKSKIKVSALPGEISLTGGSSTTQDVGTIYVGNQTSINYEVQVSKDAKTGTYPITFEFTGNYGTSVDNYKAYSYSKTFYLNITKTEKEKDKSQYKPFLIQNIKHPAIINKGDVADLTFSIKNPNDKPMSSIKVSVSPDEGIVNQTQGVFVENNFPANGEKTFNVKLFAQDKAEKKNYSIKLTVEPTNPTEQTDSKSSEDSNETPKILPTSTQYTGIFYNAPDKDEVDGVKNPQIIISSYSYGGTYVEPNQQFPLTMSFVNTSSQKVLRNIKISLNAEEGTFIAVNSSNSFYIDSMSPNSSVTKTINFVTKPDATTKTVAMTIDYTYEDTKGTALTAKDSISIPVMQKTLLSIDDVAQPQDVMEGEPVNISLNFYNLGKTKISNLKMVASGDFTVQGENSYFVGNLEPGKNDSFSISAMPNDPNKISGVIDFTYEKLDGSIETAQKKFNFTLNPISPMPDNNNMDDIQPPKHDNKIIYIGVGIAVVIIIGIILKKRHNKRKKSQELDLDE
ncbi:hypothetical protein HMPREF9630_00130 [Peptoanaerobacter stomatis]|uniref:CARDB domain-containing protein n=1 Tax=Peptoanaerobacter stomatis TaxID=796937 RepID=V9HRK2_9FIRM|nr:hypothetical protein [Peptoanaerobacter stomatis]EHL18405.1 hypothetical protein HMPREF9630_00130 [Peptoanaerobacter stomatis]